MRGFLLLLLALSWPAFAADRVVTLSPHLAELVCAAGGCDRLAGVVAHSDFPPRVRTLPQVGDAFAVNVEQVIALQPDLILAWTGGTPRTMRERLRGLELRVEDVEIRTLEDVAEGLRRVGRLIGTEQVAGKAADAYTARLRALRQQHAGLAPVRVLYQIETNPLYSVNRLSPISQALALCGGRNIFDDLPTIAAAVDREAVVARDPEVIVYARQDDVAGIRESWERAPPTTASRLGNLYAVDGDLLDRATPRLLDGIEQLCGVLSDARVKIRATASPSRPAVAQASAPPRTGDRTGD